MRSAALAALQRPECTREEVETNSLLLSLLDIRDAVACASATDAAASAHAAGSSLTDLLQQVSTSSLRTLVALPRADISKPADVAMLWAAACGDARALQVFMGPASSDVLFDDALALAVDAGHIAATDVLLEHQLHADAAPLSAVATLDDTQRFHRAMSTALGVSVARGHKSLTHHLLHKWRADPTADGSAAFWLAAESRDVDTADSLLQCPALRRSDDGDDGADAPEAAAARVDKDIVRLDTSSGDLGLLEALLQDRPSAAAGTLTLRRSIGPRLGDAWLAQEASFAARHAVLTRLLLDPRADAEASGSAALKAAAMQGRVSLLEALLADPRVDALSFATKQLLRPRSAVGVDQDALPGVPLRVLARQPSLLSALALPRGDVPAVRPHSLDASDLAAMARAAWRRRRAAVTAYFSYE